MMRMFMEDTAFRKSPEFFTLLFLAEFNSCMFAGVAAIAHPGAAVRLLSSQRESPDPPELTGFSGKRDQAPACPWHRQGSRHSGIGLAPTQSGPAAPSGGN